MKSDRLAAIGLWMAIPCAWLGFLVDMLYVSSPLPLSLQALYVLSALGVSIYAIHHSWTNPNLAFRTKLNWLAAIFMTWFIAATAYIIWWRFHASKRVQPGVLATAEESSAGHRLQRLTSRKYLEIVRFNLIVAWICCTAIIVLFFRGSFLVSTEVLIPLFTGLTTSAIAMIWAVRVIECLEQEMGEGERLLWIVFVAATWMIGATLVWLKVRARESAIA